MRESGPARLTFLVHIGKEYTARKLIAAAGQREWGRAMAAGLLRVRCYPGVRATGRSGWKRIRQRLRALRVGALREADLVANGPQIYVFTDLDRLRGDEVDRAETLWERLDGRADTLCILNHPRRALRRHGLLSRLHGDGINRFASYRLAEWREGGGAVPRRWPVFLRDESDHYGNFSALLRDAAELRLEIASREARGEDLRGQVLVEHLDVADDEGIVRKYGAFRVGDRVVARQIHFSRQWMVKVPDIVDRTTAGEELAYVEENPHAAELMPIFERAEIDYGRIDYSLLDGEIQVWEINTNPMILIPADLRDPLRGPAHERFGARFCAALAALGESPR